MKINSKDFHTRPAEKVNAAELESRERETHE